MALLDILSILIRVNLLPQIATNYQAEVHIFKQFHKNIIGKGGSNIRKVSIACLYSCMTLDGVSPTGYLG